MFRLRRRRSLVTFALSMSGIYFVYRSIIFYKGGENSPRLPVYDQDKDQFVKRAASDIEDVLPEAFDQVIEDNYRKTQKVPDIVDNYRKMQEVSDLQNFKEYNNNDVIDFENGQSKNKKLPPVQRHSSRQSDLLNTGDKSNEQEGVQGITGRISHHLLDDMSRDRQAPNIPLPDNHHSRDELQMQSSDRASYKRARHDQIVKHSDALTSEQSSFSHIPRLKYPIPEKESVVDATKNINIQQHQSRRRYRHDNTWFNKNENVIRMEKVRNPVDNINIQKAFKMNDLNKHMNRHLGNHRRKGDRKSYFVRGARPVKQYQTGIPPGQRQEVSVKARQFLNVTTSVQKPPLIYTGDKTLPSVPFNYLPLGFNETDDRISKQLALRPRASVTKPKLKVILDMTFNRFSSGQDHFLEMECPVNTCSRVTYADLGRENTHLDAVILMSAVRMRHIYPKRPGTIWIYFNLESPVHTSKLTGLNNMVNWTATYRVDSTIMVPYWQYNRSMEDGIHGDNQTDENQRKNYAEGKTKMAAWFVSNCNDKSGRLAYAKELQKYIPVDIYGSCGDMDCSREDMQTCLNMLKKDYKFFLAFENSICKDYITEKLHHALRNGAVPIVLGAPRSEYERMAPPGSFIHVDDFQSPEHLAQYLQYLSQNDTAYNEYFLWKGHGEFVENKFMCRICALLHEPLPPIWYEDLDAWWRGDNSSFCDLSKDINDDVEIEGEE